MIYALHGNVGSTADFDFLPDVTPIDLWQHSHLSLKDAAAEIRSQAKNQRPRGILGYSMGGRIALQSLADAPNFWDFAIIISAHPGLTSEKERRKRIQSDEKWAQELKTGDWDQFLEKWNSQPTLSGPVSKNQSALKSKRKAISAGFQNWSLGQQENLRPRLVNHPCPIFWIVGERDEKYIELGTETVTQMPNGLLVKAPDCGHRVLLEAQDAIRSLLESIA
ncbi:MAG: alpha/beta fold hydrolase [Verrucomicrobiales bacterium]|nr:alpha/beta fold hydrolase [Verrucomicrobiales bacterium]